MLPEQHPERGCFVQHVRGDGLRAPAKLASAALLPSRGADHMVRPGHPGAGRHLLRRVVRQLRWKRLLESPRRERLVLQGADQEDGRLCNLSGYGVHGAGVWVRGRMGEGICVRGHAYKEPATSPLAHRGEAADVPRGSTVVARTGRGTANCVVQLFSLFRGCLLF